MATEKAAAANRANRGQKMAQNDDEKDTQAIAGEYIPACTGDGKPRRARLGTAKGKLRPEQAVFLERIRCAGGVAFMARDCRDVLRELATLTKGEA